MSAVVALERETATDLIASKVLTPAVVFAPGGVASILKKITDEVRSIKTDISTAGGRAAITSLAHKVARSKTALDEMGKTLVADWKAQSAAVDAERRTIRETLDALKDEVRKPLTDWEDIETARVAAHESALATLQTMGAFDRAEPTLAEVDRRIVAFMERPQRDWQEFTSRASDASARVLKLLTGLRLARRAGAPAPRAVTAKREAEVAREQQDRDARIAAEAVARAKAAADAAAQRAEREKQAAVAAERQRAAAVKAAEDAATAKREANKKHAAKIHNEIRDALLGLGLENRVATDVVASIARGEIPHVKISY